jgi:thymidylate kinase
MSIGWCKQPEAGLPKPDAVFFLTLSPEALSKRGGFGTERYEVAEIQKNVRNNFLELEDDLWQVCTVLSEGHKAYRGVVVVCILSQIRPHSLF